jgi:mono/diheme cytochrome c family protein
MNIRIFAALAAVTALAGPTAALADDVAHTDRVDRGRYVVLIAGCNDCHTAAYAESMGQVPESQWLMGDALGWQGPWGTTYAPNLRLSLAQMTEAEWVAFARNLQSRPPMPSFNLNQMSEDDLRSVYAFIRTLQPLGEPAPGYLPPDQVAATAVVQFPAPPAD